VSLRSRALSRARRKGRGRVFRKMGPGGLRRLALAAVALGVVWAALAYFGPGPKAASGPATTVILTRGSNLANIAGALDKAKVISSPTLFMVAAKVSGASRSLKAGEYRIASHEPMARILSDIHRGRFVRHVVTVPEGFTSQMVADVLMAEPLLTGPAVAPPEGAILPNTYEIQRGETRAEVLLRMENAQTKLLKQLWAHRAPGLPYKSPQEAVTLASIVEKETAVNGERPRIAAVFLNRLARGMKLESDPTIIYGLTQGRALGRPILASEVTRPTPYNTYVIAGLPPTPIANPGKAALEAVANPSRTKELYFVADGTGGHVFAETLEEHNENVARYRAWQKKQAEEAAQAGKAPPAEDGAGTGVVPVQ